MKPLSELTRVKCPHCGEVVIIPDVPVRNTGLMSCSKRHLFWSATAKAKAKARFAALGAEFKDALTFDGERSFSYQEA